MGHPLYLGFRFPPAKRIRGIRAKRGRTTVSFGRGDFFDMTMFKDYRRLDSYSALFLGLWKRYKTELEDAGHWPPEEAPEDIAEYEKFLVQVASGASARLAAEEETK